MRAAFALALCAAFSLACAGMEEVVQQSLEELAPEPVPEDRLAYVGTWESDALTLVIDDRGMAELTSHSGSARSAFKAPITAWTDTSVSMGFGPAVRTLRIDAPPAEGPEGWRMTVEGQELRRIGPPPDLSAPPSQREIPAENPDAPRADLAPAPGG